MDSHLKVVFVSGLWFLSAALIFLTFFAFPMYADMWGGDWSQKLGPLIYLLLTFLFGGAFGGWVRRRPEIGGIRGVIIPAVFVQPMAFFLSFFIALLLAGLRTLGANPESGSVIALLLSPIVALGGALIGSLLSLTALPLFLLAAYANYKFSRKA